MQKIFRQLRADIGSSAHLRIEVTFSAKLLEDRYDGAPCNTVAAGKISRGREPTAAPEAFIEYRGTKLFIEPVKRLRFRLPSWER